MRRAGALALALLCFVAGAAHAQMSNNDADAAALRASQAAIGRVIGDYGLVDAHDRPLQHRRLARPAGRIELRLHELLLHLLGHDLAPAGGREGGARGAGVSKFFGDHGGIRYRHDTPGRMLAYGRDRGITDADWHFASADAATIRRLTDDVGFTWVESPRGFDHIAQVTVLDGDGRLVQQVYGQDFAPPELVEPLKSLLLGRSVERASARGLIERVRLYCSVYDPVTGRYRFDVTMFAAAIPPLMVLGIVALGLVVIGRRGR